MSIARESHQTINLWQRQHEGVTSPQEALIELEVCVENLKKAVSDNLTGKVYSSVSTHELLELVAEVRIAGYKLADIHRYDADKVVDEVMNARRNRRPEPSAPPPETTEPPALAHGQ